MVRRQVCVFSLLKLSNSFSNHPFNHQTGATTVTINRNALGVSDGIIRNAVTSALNAQFAVSSPSLLADHVMYCSPPGTFREGGWIGYAYINGGFEWLSVYNDEW